MTQLSVAAGLNQLKIMNERIKRASDAQFVGMRQNGRLSSSNLSVQKFSDQAKANLASAQALIQNWAELKTKIIESNARTAVTIGKNTMSVASAVELKSSIEHHEALLRQLSTQFTQYSTGVERSNAQVRLRAEDIASKTLVGVDKANEQYVGLVETIYRQNEAELIDPTGAENQIKGLTEFIEEFKANVDLALTASNVVTMIEVSF